MNKKRTVVVFGLGCVLGANLAGLRAEGTAGGNVKDDVKQTASDVKTFVSGKKADYEKRIKEELDDLDAKIDQLGRKISGLGAEGKKKAQPRLKQLKAKRKIAGKKFAKVRAASEKEWEKFKDGVDDALHDLKNAYEDFKADVN
jgi:hypothetical protein